MRCTTADTPGDRLVLKLDLDEALMVLAAVVDAEKRDETATAREIYGVVRRRLFLLLGVPSV